MWRHRGRTMRWVLAAVVLTAIVLVAGCQHVSPLWPLTRLRGFALENGNSTIFWTSKYLICKERRRPFWSRTAVVKTYPIPKRG